MLQLYLYIYKNLLLGDIIIFNLEELLIIHGLNSMNIFMISLQKSDIILVLVMNEIENIRNDNKNLREIIDKNDQLIDDLSKKIQELLKGRYNFNLNVDQITFEQQLHQYHQQLLLKKEQELNKWKEKKESLNQIIKDQELILQKQEYQFKNNPFKTSILHSKAQPGLIFHNKSSNIKEYTTIQKEITNINNEIHKTKAILLQKRNHIQDLKLKSEDLAKMHAKIEEKASLTDDLQNARTKIQILKQRVQDHQAFLLKPTEQLQIEKDTFMDILLQHKAKNIKTQQSYLSILSDIQKSIDE